MDRVSSRRRLTYPAAVGVFAQAEVVGQRAAGVRDAGRVETECGKQFAALAVLDESIGNSQPANVRRVQAGIGYRFQHGTAETGHQCALFDRHHQRAVFDGTKNRFLIERFDESRVNDANVEPFVAQLLRLL